MLSSLRRLPWGTFQPSLPPSCRRGITFSAIRRAGPDDLEGAENIDAAEGSEAEVEYEESARRMNSAEMLEAWLEGEGAKFKTPIRPNNWLGGHVVEFYFI